jgi:hypothetical protein
MGEITLNFNFSNIGSGGGRANSLNDRRQHLAFCAVETYIYL